MMSQESGSIRAGRSPWCGVAASGMLAPHLLVRPGESAPRRSPRLASSTGEALANHDHLLLD